MVAAGRIDLVAESELKVWDWSAHKPLVEAAGGRADYLVADLSTRAGCEAVVDFTIATHGRIDVLVNNAGIPDRHMPTNRTSDELWDRVIAVDLTGVFYLCRAALKHMEAQSSGSIVNISSIGARGLAGAARPPVIGGYRPARSGFWAPEAGSGAADRATGPSGSRSRTACPAALSQRPRNK